MPGLLNPMFDIISSCFLFWAENVLAKVDSEELRNKLCTLANKSPLEIWDILLLYKVLYFCEISHDIVNKQVV